MRSHCTCNCCNKSKKYKKDAHIKGLSWFTPRIGGLAVHSQIVPWLAEPSTVDAACPEPKQNENHRVFSYPPLQVKKMDPLKWGGCSNLVSLSPHPRRVPQPHHGHRRLRCSAPFPRAPPPQSASPASSPSKAWPRPPPPRSGASSLPGRRRVRRMDGVFGPEAGCCCCCSPHPFMLQVYMCCCFFGGGSLMKLPRLAVQEREIDLVRGGEVGKLAIHGPGENRDSLMASGCCHLWAC